MRHLLPLRYVDVVARTGSIRKAAEQLAITSTALNRRILAMEEDLGVQIFERMPQGVRLSTAGEVLIHHIRNQLADMQRVQSQIADLSGERRGHVRVAASPVAISSFIPRLITQYRRQHPGVNFSVIGCKPSEADAALADYSADIAVVFRPITEGNLYSVCCVEQPLTLICDHDHPLARRSTLRLGECLDYPMALPLHPNGVRILVENVARRCGRRPRVAVESDNFALLRAALSEPGMLGMQIPVGLAETEVDARLQHIPLMDLELRSNRLHLGYLRGRTLPVAAARFLEHVQLFLESTSAAGEPDSRSSPVS